MILNIDGQPTPTSKEVNQILGKYKPGDKVTIEITRDGKPMKLRIDLVSSDQMAPKMNGDQLTHLSEAGGTVSKRHNNFANALTHDTVLQAAQCGGPVVDLDGRADRSEHRPCRPHRQLCDSGGDGSQGGRGTAGRREVGGCLIPPPARCTPPPPWYLSNDPAMASMNDGTRPAAANTRLTTIGRG